MTPSPITIERIPGAAIWLPFNRKITCGPRKNDQTAGSPVPIYLNTEKA
jgi:hypothetical protein